MKSILVTGSNGQLGTSLLKLSDKYSQFTFTSVDIQDLDLTQEEQGLAYFKQHHFDYVINCAAYTAVDQAEKNPEKAFAVNTKIPEKLGLWCSEKLTKIIHLSTDYIYNGKSQCTPSRR